MPEDHTAIDTVKFLSSLSIGLASGKRLAVFDVGLEGYADYGHRDEVTWAGCNNDLHEGEWQRH